MQTEKQQKLLVVLDLSFGNLSRLQNRNPTSFQRRFLEEFEESFHVLSKAAFDSFELFIQRNISARMDGSPHLHVSMPHVEKLADLPMLLPTIFPLTSLGTIQGGLENSSCSSYCTNRTKGRVPYIGLQCWMALDTQTTGENTS
jgi:hypothetical protein